MPAIELRRAFWPAILFRWLLWTLSIGLLIAGILVRLPLATALVLALTTGLYTLLWTLRVADLTRIASRWPAVLLLDLLVSLVPTFLSGGQDSPFAPFALGALVLPGMIYHWRGALLGSLTFVTIEAAGSWAASYLGLDGGGRFFSPLLVRPIIAASVLPLSDVLWRHRPTRYALPSRTASLPLRSETEPRAGLMRSMEAAALAKREAHPAAAAAVRLSRPHPQTLERPRATELFGAVRQAILEAEEHGLRVRLVTDGNPPPLPLSHIQLVARAVEVTLENVRCHARTLDAEVFVACSGDGVLLTVRDRGDGLLDGTAEPPGFHQLRRLRYRVEEIEGSLTVHEDPEGGVVVMARIPTMSPEDKL